MRGFGPVIHEERIRFLSVSQLERFDITTFGGCQRKWWFRYRAQKKEPELRSQKLGKQCHSQIEHYLKTGEDVLGEIVRAGKRFIPAPGADLLIEHQIGELIVEDVRSPLMSAGIPFIGLMDLVNDRGDWLDDDGVLHNEPGVVETVDWKTTSQINNEIDPNTGVILSRGYAKTAEEIANTWQMVGYAEAATKMLDPIGVRVGHGIFQTRGQRAAVKRSSLLTLPVIRERWGRAEALVESMKSVAGMPDVKTVPANLAACGAYGGCAYKNDCPRDPKAILAQLFKKEKPTMSLLAKYKSNGNGTSVPPMTAAVAAEKGKLLSEEKEIRQAKSLPAITPPDLPAPAKKVLTANLEVKPEPAKPATLVVVCALAGTQVELSTDAAVSKKFVCECGQGLKVKPTKLDDGKYYALVPKHSPETKPEPVKLEPAPIPEPAKPVLSIDEAGDLPAPAGITLYLGAREDGVTTQRLETYVYDLCRDIEKEYDAVEVRCGKKDGPLGFGGWKGVLSAVARAKPPAPGAYEADLSNELVAVVAEALVPIAARVVRGAR